MKKNVIHILVVGSCFLIAGFVLRDKDAIIDNIGWIILLSLFYFIAYNILVVKKRKKKIEKRIIDSGVFGARGLGMLINTFLLAYILDCYVYTKLSYGMIIIGIGGLIYWRKAIPIFWKSNIWNAELFFVYLSTNAIFSGIYGIASTFDRTLLFVDLPNGTSYIAKIVLLVIYVIVCRVFLVEDNWFMKIISINDQLHEE